VKKLVIIAVAVALVLSLLPGIVSAKPPLRVEKHKPVPATDIELAKMVTVQKPGPSIVPPGQSKKKDGKAAAATGELGYVVTGRRYAIVVGISDYPGTDADLSYMDENAEEMVQALIGYGFPSDNIRSLIDKDGTEAAGEALVATRANLIQAIRDTAAQVTPDDEVVFYFSGHGGRGRAADGDREKTDECIWAHDGSANLVPIWDGELEAEFGVYMTSRIIFIFDSCYAGGMTDLKATGRILAMATTENNVGYESALWENGEFTYYLVDHGMLQGNANTHDYDGDDILGEPGEVTIEEAWDYAKVNCQFNKPSINDSFVNDLLP
jgi:hypothetical protein